MWWKQLADNKLFLGILVIIANIGSRHLVDEFSVKEEEYSRNLVLRRIAIFAVCFTATHDLIVSFLLTAGFIVIAQGVSWRNREGMKNAGPLPAKAEADAPGYDKSVPPLFAD